MLKLGIGLDVTSKRITASTFDPDAQAFFNRVTAAGGTLSTTEQNAVNTLVIDMKGFGLWSIMQAIYPIVGASAASTAQNLKSSSYTGTFTSGWTFASNGVTGNGIATYYDTTLQPNIAMNYNNQSYFIYKATVQAGTVSEYGVNDGSQNGTNCFLAIGYNTIGEFVTAGRFSNITTAGAYILNRNNSNDKTLFNNGTIFQTINNAATNYTLGNLYLGARNSVAGLNSTNSQIRFFAVGDGLTNTQASNYYIAVQAFQTSLSRQV
jgi:hypothetical protein